MSIARFLKREPKTKLIKADKSGIRADELRFCVETIQRGGVIVFPTDTVYGIGCNAFNPVAIAKIYSLKGRTYKKPLPILLDTAERLALVAREVPKETDRLIGAFWPGPLTLVLKTAPMALHASRGKDTVAVRVPDHGLIRELLVEMKLPLAATSANVSGKPSLKSGAEVRKIFMGKVDVIIDGGACPVGRESSVVDASHYPFTVLREAALSKADLSKHLNL